VVDIAKGTVSQRAVTVGAREGDNIAVTSGISAGRAHRHRGRAQPGRGPGSEGAAMNGFNLSTWALGTAPSSGT
jgi:hypothetical protein